MKNGQNPLLPVPVERELKTLIEEAALKTHLSQAAVMRAALRIGVPEVVKLLGVRKQPRRNFAEYLGKFHDVLQHRNRELVKPSRFK